MALRESKRKYRPGLYYRLATWDWFRRPWPGPVYFRASRWRHDLLAVLGQLEAIARAGGSLADGLESAAREERRLLNRPSHRTAGHLIQILLTTMAFVSLSLFVLIVSTQSGYGLYMTAKMYLSEQLFDTPQPMSIGIANFRSYFGHESGMLYALAAIVVLPAIWMAFQVRYHSGALEAVFLRLRDRINYGVPLAEAMTGMKRFFPSHYADLVLAGEMSGNLTQTLHDLSKETLSGLRRHAGLQHHLVYFLMVVTLQVGLLGFLARQADPLQNGNRALYVRELPDPNDPAGGAIMGEVIEGEFDTPVWGGIVLGTLEKAHGFGYPLSTRGLATALAILAAVAWWRARHRKRAAASRPMIGAALRPMPGWRRYIVARNLTNSARALSLLLSVGMPVPDALRRLAASDLGRAYRRAFNSAANRVEQGRGLSAALDESPKLFPGGFRTLVAVGERSGLLPEALTQAADRYDRESERIVAALYESFVPVCVVILGAISLAVVAAIYQYHVALIEVMLKMVD